MATLRQPLFEHRLELSGYGTRVLELEGGGPPLLLIHGYADSADTWRLTLERLSRAGQRAVAIDLPGLRRGRRAAARAGHRAVRRVRRRGGRYAGEDGEAVVVAGNSLGGLMALRVGARDDVQVRGVVPVAPAGLDMPRWFSLIERDLVVRGLLGSPVPLPQPFVRTAVGEAYRQLAFAEPRAISADIVRMFTRHHPDARSVRHFLDVGRRMLPELAMDENELARIDVPVLLVWGDRDRMVSHQGARHVLAALPERTL